MSQIDAAVTYFFMKLCCLFVMLYLWPCAIVLQICIVSFREFLAFHMHQMFLAKLSVLNVNTIDKVGFSLNWSQYY